MKKLVLLCSLLGFLGSLSRTQAQEYSAGAEQVVNIWEEVGDTAMRPQTRLHVFLPQGGTAQGLRSVLILPGGGYSGLAMGHEGTDWADFFCRRGVAVFVLEYRMPRGCPDVPFDDVRQALRVVRARAEAWGLDARKVGIMGSSAGGHLAATAVAWLPAEERPAFQILFYPVVTMEAGVTHRGSRENLLGRDADAARVDHYSLERHVRADFPPTFIVLSNDDDVVLPRNGVQYYAALQEAGVRVSLHVYPEGGHGWGYRENFSWHEVMVGELSYWLEHM